VAVGAAAITTTAERIFGVPAASVVSGTGTARHSNLRPSLQPLISGGPQGNQTFNAFGGSYGYRPPTVSGGFGGGPVGSTKPGSIPSSGIFGYNTGLAAGATKTPTVAA
jgi:hypothetical protein